MDELKHVGPGSFVMAPTRPFTLAFGSAGVGAGVFDEAAGKAAGAAEAGEAARHCLTRSTLRRMRSSSARVFWMRFSTSTFGFQP